YQVDVLASERLPDEQGLRTVAVDLFFDSERINVVTQPFEDDAVITDELRDYRSGRVDNLTGSIEKLSGSNVWRRAGTRSIGDDAAESYASFEIQIVAAGSSVFHVRPSTTRVMLDSGRVLGMREIDYQSMAINAIDAPEVVAAENESSPGAVSVSLESVRPDVASPPTVVALKSQDAALEVDAEVAANDLEKDHVSQATCTPKEATPTIATNANAAPPAAFATELMEPKRVPVMGPLRQVPMGRSLPPWLADRLDSIDQLFREWQPGDRM
ncbi:MAG: hypothetical protein AAF745_03025, partial [Planctomycetota bacterium]